MTLLDAIDVVKRFSGITAVDRVSVSIEEGELVGLIGPNGAGKTTFFNCLTGGLRPESGRVTIDGRDVTRLPIHRRARLGVGRTYQRVELFAGMTPLEHVLVAERSRRASGALWKDVVGRGRVRPDELAVANETLELVGLASVANQPVEALGLGRARLVEVARALVCQPRLLLLDEPSSGLDRAETEALASSLRDVHRNTSLAILLVEHDLAMVQAIADRLYVMDLGGVIASGPTASVLDDPRVRHAYLGETPESEAQPARAAAAPARARAVAPPALELKHVDAAYGSFRALFDVSLSVPAGGVLALVGPNGAGKTTVARVCSGLVAPTRGTVSIGGTDVTGWRASRIARLGVACMPEGRSVFASLTVEENLALTLRRRTRDRQGALRRAYELFPRLAERRGQAAGTLSGGEQRMLALAPVLAAPPTVLIADELSLGLSPAIIDEVYRGLARVKAQGTTMLVVEQHVGHALALADRVVVLDKGTVGFEGGTDDAAFAAASRLVT